MRQVVEKFTNILASLTLFVTFFILIIVIIIIVIVVWQLFTNLSYALIN